MNCPNCGVNNENAAAFCTECGTKLAAEVPQVQIPAAPAIQPESPKPVNQEIPKGYKPLSPWAYVGWRLLFMIPVAGFVLLIVMSFAPRNKNLKNFTRSYWCTALLAIIIAVIALLLIAAIGGGFGAITELLSSL